VISHDAPSEIDIKIPVNLATGKASSMKTIWQSRELGIKTKARVYDTLVLTVKL